MVTFTLSQSVWEIVKSRAIRAMCAIVVYVPMCKRSKRVPTCQRAKGVPIIQLGMWACQRRANFLPWCTNRVPIFHFGVPKSMPNFQTFFSQNSQGNFYILLLYKKFYIRLEIIVIHIICICVVYGNCIILHFYTSAHIKEKCAEFLFFETFLFFSSKWKYKKTWFLYVTSKTK